MTDLPRLRRESCCKALFFVVVVVGGGGGSSITPLGKKSWFKGGNLMQPETDCISFY